MNASTTVEERRFERRVSEAEELGLQPLWSPFLASTNHPRGLKPHFSCTAYAALEAPLFHVTTAALSLTRVVLPRVGYDGPPRLRQKGKLKFSGCDERHTYVASRFVTIDEMDAGRTFFITAVTWKRIPIFRNEARARLLLDTLLDYREQRKYLLHAFVIMPDHIHVLLTPSPTIALERAIQFIKGGFSYRLGQREKIQVWQSGFTNHRIRDRKDYEQHHDYIRLNPVRARLVANPAEYPYSSANPIFELDVSSALNPGVSRSA